MEVVKMARWSGIEPPPSGAESDGFSPTPEGGPTGFPATPHSARARVQAALLKDWVARYHAEEREAARLREALEKIDTIVNTYGRLRTDQLTEVRTVIREVFASRVQSKG